MAQMAARGTRAPRGLAMFRPDIEALATRIPESARRDTAQGSTPESRGSPANVTPIILPPPWPEGAAAALTAEIGAPSVRSFLMPCRLDLGPTGPVLTAASRFARDHIATHFLMVLARVLGAEPEVVFAGGGGW